MTFNLGSLCMAILWNSIFIGIVFWIGKKKIYTTAKRDSSDIDVLFTWGCQDDISH